MKLTTKRNRAYFWRELFLYLIPMILIVWSVHTFTSFMQCQWHPEYSAPCSTSFLVGWVFYGATLLITILLCILSAKRLRKIKKQIEIEFLETSGSAQKDIKTNNSHVSRITKKESKNSEAKKIVIKGSLTSDKKENNKFWAIKHKTSKTQK